VTARKLMLADIARTGLTARDAGAMHLRALDASQTYALTGRRAESYMIPYFLPDGRVNGFARVRFTGDCEQRYWQNAKGCRLYLPPFVDWAKIMRDPAVRLYVTEGEKKAAALCKHDVPCVGLGGVENWRKDALDELDGFDLEGREVAIVFDSPDA
jgi:hypothetical protein